MAQTGLFIQIKKNTNCLIAVSLENIIILHLLIIATRRPVVWKVGPLCKSKAQSSMEEAWGCDLSYSPLTEEFWLLKASLLVKSHRDPKHQRPASTSHENPVSKDEKKNVKSSTFTLKNPLQKSINILKSYNEHITSLVFTLYDKHKHWAITLQVKISVKVPLSAAHKFHTLCPLSQETLAIFLILYSIRLWKWRNNILECALPGQQQPSVEEIKVKYISLPGSCTSHTHKALFCDCHLYSLHIV